MLLNIYIMGGLLSATPCLITILKTFLYNEDVKPDLFSTVLILGFAFIISWLGVYSLIKYRLEQPHI